VSRRPRIHIRWSLIALALPSGCGALPPEAQVIVHVDTDAPLPPGVEVGGESGSPPGLFDRVRFDVYPPGASTPCSGCTSVFAVTREQLAGEGVSMGVLAEPHTSGYRLRVRLYREQFQEVDEPLSRTSLDATVALPAVGDGEVTDVTVFLPVEAVGQARGSLESPGSPRSGSPGASQVGTWPGARRRSCAEPPPDGMACIPGGAFWMGHPFVPGGLDRDDSPAPRLVVVAPFYLDTTEVTVGAFRRWLLDEAREPASDPAARTSDGFFVPRNYCNLPDNLLNDEMDGLPVNCVSRARAAEYCATHNASLPTEAQLEYASGGLEALLYVWGGDEPTCDDAVHARAPRAGSDLGRYPGDCLTDARGGPRVSRSGQRDALPLGGGKVWDLAGNVAELARDDWQGQSGECWMPTLLRDPLCEDGESGRQVVRGGSWTSEPHELRAAYRASISPEDVDDGTHLGPMIGFRCVREASSQ
jgi:formylglycine-generating enzyme